MAVKIAEIETQKKAGTSIANAVKLLIKKAKEQRKEQKRNKKKRGRGKLFD